MGLECTPKDAAAIGALEVIERLGFRSGVIGVGTGSTVARFIERGVGLLGDSTLVASSLATALELSSRGLNPIDPRAVRRPLDLYIDGADEVDPEGRMIKGRGAALLGEKILAHASRLNIFIVDESKLVSRLGERKPLPVEVVPDSLGIVLASLERMGLPAEPRTGGGKDGPVVSDWGGIIVDIRLSQPFDPEELERELLMIPGVVETGLFIGLADFVVVGLEGCRWRVMRFNRRRGLELPSYR